MAELCEQPSRITLTGTSFELAYPEAQELEIYFSSLRETTMDRENQWLRTCFPRIELEIPAGLIGLFALQDI